MKRKHANKGELEKFYGGKDRVIVAIENACSPSNKREQAESNTAYLRYILNSAGYFPQIHSVACCWNGYIGAGGILDFTIRHKRVPDAFLSEWETEYLKYMESKSDRGVKRFLEKLKEERYELTCKFLYDMITENYHKQRLGNVRGYTAQFINRKVMERNLEGTEGVARHVKIIPLRISMDGIQLHVSDAEIDLVVSIPSGDEYQIFLENLQRDKDIELWVNHSING